MVRGFASWKAAHPSFDSPHIHCVQPSGNDTIAGPLRQGLHQARTLDQSTTLVSGLQVPSVMDGNEVIAGCRASAGNGHVVADEEVFRAQRDLAAMEGIYAEPAGAVALAGLRGALARGEVDQGSAVVCLVSGHGFKDPASVEKMAQVSKGQYFDAVADL